MVDELKITNIDDILYPNKSLINSFYISDRIFEGRKIEVTQLTFLNLIKTCTRNQLKIFYFKFWYLFYRLGFIDLDECEKFTWKKFTIHCSRTLEARRNYIKNIQNKEYQKVFKKLKEN